MHIMSLRVLSKLTTLILALAMLSSTLPLTVSLAAAQPKITWSETHLSLQMSPGSGEVREVTFASDHNLQDVTIEAVPEIADLVSIQPTTIASIRRSSSNRLSLFLYSCWNQFWFA